MPENISPEDQAALYVLGGLSAGELRDFKSRLAESAVLRALVRELQDGAVALALTAPKKLPPQKVWHRIEKTIARENRAARLTPLFPRAWWRNGWAAAAACLAGWLLYAFWPGRPAVTVTPPIAAIENHLPGETTPALAAPSKALAASHPTSADTDDTRQLLQAGAHEIGDLRAQIAALQTRVMHLSQSITQDQALLGESSRLKFVQLTPVSSGDSPPPTVPLSPELQRALALAMARELGWAQSTETSAIETNGAEIHSPVTTISNVDFVDLRPGTNGYSPSFQSQPQPQPQTQQQSQANAQMPDTQTQPPPPDTPHIPIPAFISGQSLMMAIDSSIAAKGSQLSFSVNTPDQGETFLGTATVGDNPLVITVPTGFGFISLNAGSLGVRA